MSYHFVVGRTFIIAVMVQSGVFQDFDLVLDRLLPSSIPSSDSGT